MLDEQQIASDLLSFAESQVMLAVERAPTAWTRDQIEDAVQELFAAGWADWKKTSDAGLAKNRIVCRVANLLRDRQSRRNREKRTRSLTDYLSDGQRDVADHHREHEPDDSTLAIQKHLASLPERERKIVQLRLAGLTQEEIAEETGLHVRTIQRIFRDFKKEMIHVENH